MKTQEKNRLQEQVKLLRMLQAKGIAADSPEVKLITELLNDEFDYGYRTAEYDITGKMGERAYGTGKHTRP